LRTMNKPLRDCLPFGYRRTAHIPRNEHVAHTTCSAVVWAIRQRLSPINL
jgi:hypothetical protein